MSFILDVYARVVVGWQIAAQMRTDLVFDALEMAAYWVSVDHFVELSGCLTGFQRKSNRVNEAIEELRRPAARNDCPVHE